MAVYILSALLLIILAFAIVQLSKKSEVEAEIDKLKQRNQLSLMAELRAAEKVVWLCFTGGLLLTANYAITYFSGSELVNIPNWGFIQWSGAFIGLVIAVSITFVQKVLYSSPTHSKAGLIVTTLVLTFVIISEIGSPIEKEGMKMKEASQNSAVFKAVIGEIQGGIDTTSRYSNQIATAMAEKAQHEFELQRCERHDSKGEKRVKRCEDYENRLILQAQAKIDSYKSSASTTTRSNESSRFALIQQAKALEYNTNNHSELVKLTASMLGASFLSSMMFLSLILIVAFEAGFHFVGSRVGILKTALSEMGNKEILQDQKLVSLKKAKKFKDKSSDIDLHNELDIQGKQDNKANPLSVPKTTLNTGYTSAATFAPIRHSDAPLGTKKPSTPTPADKVNKSLSAGVKLEPKEKHKQIQKIDFDAVYKHIKQKIGDGKIRLSITNMRKLAHRYIKANSALKNTSISIPETSYLVDKIKDKMLKEKFIIENPHYSNGKAKYLLVNNV